jgi:hypothetical protein
MSTVAYAVAVIEDKGGKRGYELWDDLSRTVGFVAGGIKELHQAGYKGVRVVNRNKPWRIGRGTWNSLARRER